uniref:Uncharacterized protein n=1 Tax=Amphimedon queenslandica TaxID=400682 RepID=A0A1X7SDJ7_AMPQE
MGNNSDTVVKKALSLITGKLINNNKLIY